MMRYKDKKEESNNYITLSSLELLPLKKYKFSDFSNLNKIENEWIDFLNVENVDGDSIINGKTYDNCIFKVIVTHNKYSTKSIIKDCTFYDCAISIIYEKDTVFSNAFYNCDIFLNPKADLNDFVKNNFLFNCNICFSDEEL